MAAKASKTKKTKTKKSAKSPKAVRPPRDLTDVVELADWLEVLALTSRDGSASKADLFSLLRKAGGYNPATQKDKIDEMCLQAFFELENRRKAAGNSYPFVVQLPTVRAKSDALKKYAAYVFCLCLSAWRWKKSRAERPRNARQLFEDLSCTAAKNYLSGEVIRFASPRDSSISSFPKAIEYLCTQVGEGGGFREGVSPDAKKDDTLDVVAWKSFPDDRFGKLVLLGQCASGGNWKEKRQELDVEYFENQWMRDRLTTKCVRAFFIPHRLPNDGTWGETIRRAGITFDRCRIAYWAENQKPLPGKAPMVAWAKTAISKQ